MEGAGRLVLPGRPYEHGGRFMTGSMPAEVPREPDQRDDLGGCQPVFPDHLDGLGHSPA
jgi:hypothetical protein